MRRNSKLGFAVIAGVLVSFLLFLVLAMSVDPGRVMTREGRVAVMPIEGMIMDVQEAIEQIEEYRDDPSVRAIVLRIDSPGGAVAPSQELYQAVSLADAVKPVVTSVGSLCASGGYYAAVGSRHIMANPGSIVGSIGVIMQFPDASELLKWLKVDLQLVKSGPYKDIGSPARPLGKEEEASLQALVDSVYGQFVSAVVDGRLAAGMNTDSVIAIADGRIFSGQQALALGMVDSLGSLNDAVDLAAELGGIDGKPTIVRPRRPGPRFLDFITGGEALGAHFFPRAGFPGMFYLWKP